MKEGPHLLGECPQSAECGVEALLQVGFVFDGLPADLSVFDFVPDLFVGIEFGGMGGEKEQPELGPRGADELAHRRRAMERGAIGQRDQRAGTVPQEVLQKGDEPGAIPRFGPPRWTATRPAR